MLKVAKSHTKLIFVKANVSPTSINNHLQLYRFDHLHSQVAKMAPSNLPPIFNATSQDIEMLLAAQSHLGSKNLQVHMEPYLWKTRPDGINVINIGKTWYVDIGRDYELHGASAQRIAH